MPHTAHSLGHAVPALCREHVGLNDVLHGPCPSLPNPPPKVSLPLFRWFTGTTAQSDFSSTYRRSVYGLRVPALIVRPRRAGDLPVLVHVVSQRARVLRLRRTEQSTREITWLSCCLPPLGMESASCSIGFSQLNSPAHQCLCLRFKRHLAVSPARLEVRMDSLLPFP